MLRATSLGALLAAGCLAAAGCGGGEPVQAGGSGLGGGDGAGETSGGGNDAPVGEAHARGDNRAATRVGAAGGTLELASGARVEIPAGAITTPVDVVIQRAPPTDAFNNREDERIAGPTFIVTPALNSSNGSKFVVSVPMTTSVPDGFEQTDVAIAYERVAAVQRGMSAELDTTQTRWDHGPASVRSGRMVAELDQLPGFRLQFVWSR